MKYTLIILFLFASLPVFSQLTEADKTILRTELLSHVNKLRAEQQVPLLSFDDVLRSAAELHSAYMSENQILTHEEKKATLKEPKDRVERAGGKDFELVGENVLYTVPQEFPLKKKELSLLALAIFEQWKNSPPHYKNLIFTEYTLGDFGFAVDPKTKVIYATQVFGRKGVQVPGQLSENAFGLVEGTNNPDCSLLKERYDNFLTNMGNATYVEGNRVLFGYHNKEKFFRLLMNQPTDGVAVDLVFKDHVACGKPNELDFSPIFDGILLEPFYRDELLENNEAESDYRLITQIGEIPEQYLGAAYSISLIVIKNGKKCSYEIPIEIYSDKYELTLLEPELINPQQIEFAQKGIIRSVEIPFDFKNNKIVGSFPSEELGQEGSIHAIDIVSYSSVDGDSANNDRLHKGRAEFMLQQLKNHLSFNDELVKITASENWPLAGFQFEYFGYEGLSKQSHDSVRQYLRTDKSQELKEMLASQRRSYASIHYSGMLNSEGSTGELITLNLRTAILTNNTPLANKALFELYNEPIPDLSCLFEESIMERLMQNPVLVQNAAAVLSLEINGELYETTKFLNAWIPKLNELPDHARLNLLNLYTHVASRLLDEWDVPSQRLAKVIHPKKVETSVNQLKNNTLLLNFHLSAIEYYGQMNDGPNIGKSFDFIADHFRKEAASMEEMEKLALFFNSWSRYDLSIPLLQTKLKESNFSDLAALLLMTTAFAYDTDLTEQQLEQYSDKLFEKDPFMWCTWVNNNFQIKRHTFVKNRFCSGCSQTEQ